MTPSPVFRPSEDPPSARAARDAKSVRCQALPAYCGAVSIRLLHTADWHVGKTLRGRSRQAEHDAVLEELVALADHQAVDVVVIAGDLFDGAAPSPEAERTVYRALLGLAGTSRHVIVVAGNHDNPRRLAALRPLLALGRIHMATEVWRPEAGGVIDLELPGGRMSVALLPWLSARYVVRAADLLSRDADQHQQSYAARVGQIVRALCGAFSPGSVNVLVGHLHALGGLAGGGERSAHTVMEYAVPATVFPPQLHYVALGHLHRTQQVFAPVPVHYPGSLLQLDFGEDTADKATLIVDLSPGTPARVQAHTLHSGRRLRTVTGTLGSLALTEAASSAQAPTDWLRVVLEEPTRAGLAEEVRDLLGDGVLDVTVLQPKTTADQSQNRPARLGRSPHELFAEYLTDRNVVDPRVEALFAELLEVAGNSSADLGADDAA